MNADNLAISWGFYGKNGAQGFFTGGRNARSMKPNAGKAKKRAKGQLTKNRKKRLLEGLKSSRDGVNISRELRRIKKGASRNQKGKKWSKNRPLEKMKKKPKMGPKWAKEVLGGI